MTNMNEGGLPEPGRPRSAWSGVLRSIILPAGILAVVLGGLWYWGARGGGGTSHDQFGVVPLPVEKNATSRHPAAEVGRAAPDFLLERAGGGTLRLSDLQGGPVLVNFWATWCPPCREEMPELVKAYAGHRDEGLQIVGLNLQETDRRVRDFAEDFGIEFPLVIDRDGEMEDAWRPGGPFGGIPTTYFIDRLGVVRDIVYGPLTEDDLEERLVPLLGGAS